MSGLLCCIAAIGLHVGSAHFDSDIEGLNPVNPGIYVELDNGWLAGGYYNSLRRTSLYAGYQFKGPFIGPVQPALTVGVITGYPGGAMPAVVPSAYIDLGDVGLRLSYIPKVNVTKVHTLHLAIEKRF
jgi:hypothetical protein